MNTKIKVVASAIAVILALSGCSAGGSLIHTDASASDKATTASASASADPTTNPSPDPSANPTGDGDANAMANVAAPSVLDDWAYPTKYVELVQKYGYTTQTFNGQSFPVFKIGSLADDTVWPDSVRGPLTTKSAEEVFAHVLGEPDYCAQVAVGLSSTDFVAPNGDIISVKNNNPWFKEMLPVDIADVNNWAVDVMSGNQGKQLQAAKKCALVATLLQQLYDGGVLNLTTALNYHVATGDSLTVNASNPFGTIREFELNPVQYTGEFVVLEFRLKGQPSVCENQILFNTGDGRFARPVCTLPPTSTPPPTTPPPTHKKTCASEYPNFPHGTYPVCKDDAGHDPSYNGNNKVGGNGQAPAVTAGPSAPGGGVPAQIYVVPAAPAPAPVPTGSTPVPTPEPAPVNQGGGLQ